MLEYGQPRGSMNVPVKNTVPKLMTPSQFNIYGTTTVFRIQSYNRWKGHVVLGASAWFGMKESRTCEEM